MYSRSFLSVFNKDKTKFLQATVEWHTAFTITPLLEKQIIKTHVASFLDLYRDYSEADLGRKDGETKKTWLTGMIEAELAEIKKGNIFLATVSIENNVAGFITCLPAKLRHTKASSSSITQVWGKKRKSTSSAALDATRHSTTQHEATKPKKWQDSIRKDVYISLLAIKPCYSSHTKNKIQMGLGRLLVESAEAKMTDANALVLDTRLINKPGIAFYQTLGFSTTGKRTFDDADSAHYTGCEKRVMRMV